MSNRVSSRATREPAATSPIARLMVDVGLSHLDRPFDYLVPAGLDHELVVGSRVRVRFAGRLVDGYVLERRAASEHDGKLAYVERVVGADAVLTAETAALFRAVADRWAGTFVDVARLGIPSRHAGAESLPSEATDAPVPSRSPTGSAPSGFARYRAGPAFLAAVGTARPARAVWSALPGESWADRLAEAAAAAWRSGRGAVVVVPDGRDLERLDVAMTAALGTGQHVALAADLGPSQRFRRWLAVRRGLVRVVIGTRSAAYAPVADLALLAIWDDGDDSHVEPRAPYAHVRDVLTLRSSLTGAALLLGAFARTAEAAQLVESGWAHEIVADRTQLRLAAARIAAVGDDLEQARDAAASGARLPNLALRTARASLAAGEPVLVQVPRRGYVTSLSCVRDRTPARCANCAGPLAATSAAAIPTCRWCGRPAADWTCPACGGRRMRAGVVGAVRTAEELGRAFAGFPVRTSGGDHVLSEVEPGPALVVATPGAEPSVAGGYGAALLLDGWALLSRPDLRAAEETLRRWMNASALVRAGGQVVVGADAALAAVQALIRWDPAGAAARELAERAEVGFSPAVRMASLTGASAAILEVSAANLPPEFELIGPIPAGEGMQRLLIRVPRSRGGDLARSLKAVAAARSARKASESIKVVLDPTEL